MRISPDSSKNRKTLNATNYKVTNLIHNFLNKWKRIKYMWIAKIIPFCYQLMENMFLFIYMCWKVWLRIKKVNMLLWGSISIYLELLPIWFFLNMGKIVLSSRKWCLEANKKPEFQICRNKLKICRKKLNLISVKKMQNKILSIKNHWNLTKVKNQF